MIELDGSIGGGQILRTALTLSMITGEAFRIENIRAKRAKPGLMRQHLVAVQAAAQVCGGEAAGAVAGSQELSFRPGLVRAGEYRFAIGTAGSCTLVLQTLIPALLLAGGRSRVEVSGGTHNPLAPPAQFLQRAYSRALADMGAAVDIRLNRFGFFPAGGGEVTADIEPCERLRPFEWMERGARKAAYAESFIAGVPLNVARRELDCIGRGMGWDESQLLVRGLPGEQGPGNALLVTLEHEHVTEVVAAFGEKSVRAEEVGRQALNQVRRYLASGAAVGEHLADQLMLPLALAGGGGFTTDIVSAHATANAQVIERFLPVHFSFGERGTAKTCGVLGKQRLLA
jgi:RNA 3'-terminal phosphate cyclase (ATP)